jgi:hypothetical protein
VSGIYACIAIEVSRGRRSTVGSAAQPGSEPVGAIDDINNIAKDGQASGGGGGVDAAFLACLRRRFQFLFNRVGSFIAAIKLFKLVILTFVAAGSRIFVLDYSADSRRVLHIQQLVLGNNFY